jgi:hypothetical protein
MTAFMGFTVNNGAKHVDQAVFSFSTPLDWQRIVKCAHLLSKNKTYVAEVVHENFVGVAVRHLNERK